MPSIEEPPAMLPDLPSVPHADRDLPGEMELGAFSISLNVADLEVSRRFYGALGFVVTGGDEEQGYLILKNGETTIGIFHAMFDGSILTFNPGLTNRMERIEDFLDVRDIARRLEEAGIALDVGIAPEAGDAGPAHVSLTDPDGNSILIDQFF